MNLLVPLCKVLFSYYWTILHKGKERLQQHIITFNIYCEWMMIYIFWLIYPFVQWTQLMTTESPVSGSNMLVAKMLLTWLEPDFKICSRILKTFQQEGHGFSSRTFCYHFISIHENNEYENVQKKESVEMKWDFFWWVLYVNFRQNCFYTIYHFLK